MGRWFANVCVVFLAGIVRLALNAVMVLLGLAQPLCWLLVAIFTIKHFWIESPFWEPLVLVGVSFGAFVLLAAVAAVEFRIKTWVENWLERPLPSRQVSAGQSGNAVSSLRLVASNLNRDGG